MTTLRFAGSIWATSCSVNATALERFAHTDFMFTLIFEHDVQIDLETVLARCDEHALAQTLTGEQAHAFGALQLLSHANHAIARHGCVTGDIGDDIIRDAQSSRYDFRHGNLLI